MKAYLDANVVIYAVEAPPPWGKIANDRLHMLQNAGYSLVTSDAARLECLVMPLRTGDVRQQQSYHAFFATPTLTVYSLTTQVCERAALIRAQYRFQALDSLHLAAAVENGCDLFVTNDMRLQSFPDVKIDLLA